MTLNGKDDTAREKPPEPPEMRRRFVLERSQWIGVPLMLLIPLTALFGLYGPGRGQAVIRTSGLEMSVDHPSKTHYRMDEVMVVAVRNASDQPLGSVEVGFDRSYIEAFSSVTFTPDPDRVTEREIRVPLEALGPGESRRVLVSMRAEQRWRLDGAVRALAREGPVAQVRITTFVMP